MWGNLFAEAELHCILYSSDDYIEGLEMELCPLQFEDFRLLKSASLYHCRLLCCVQNKYLDNPLHST